MMSLQAPLDRGRPAAGYGSFGERLRAVMHPFLANAILTAAVANSTGEIRRDLSSSNADRRTKAENTLVERLVASIYEADGENAGWAE